MTKDNSQPEETNEEKKTLTEFNFPAEGVTIKAENFEAALKELKKLSPNT